MLNLYINKKINITDFGIIKGLLFLILLGFKEFFSFVFGIMFLLLNCLKNIYYIQGMKTIY